MKTRSAAVVLVLGLLLGVLSACGGGGGATPGTSGSGGSAAPGKQKTIAVVMPNATHGFLGESIKHAEAYVKQESGKQGFKYKFLTSAEASEQNNQLDQLINEKPDAVVLWPHNGDELRSGAQKIMDAKIPLVIYDRLIPNLTPTLEVMGDNTKIGKMTGEHFSKYLAKDLEAGEVKILEFKGDDSTVPQQRSDGFKSTAHKNLKVVQQFSTGWQRAKAQEQMETFLTSGKPEDIAQIKAVFTHDDEVLLGVLDAIQAYKGPAKLNIKLVSGVGGRRENLDTFKPIKDKLGIDQVTYLFSPVMVRNAVEFGVKIMNGEKLSGQKLIETKEITAANEAEFRKSEDYKIRYESGI